MKRLLLLGMLLSGCVSIPQKDMGKVESTPSLELSTQTAFDTEHFYSSTWPNPNWWEMFEDEELNSVITRALAENPTLMQAEARVKVARETALEKRSILFPELDARYEESWQHLSKNGLFRFDFPTFPAVINLVDLALDFHYEFDFWGKNRNLLRAALGKEHAATAEYAQAQLILTTAICIAYFEVQGAQEKEKIMREILNQRRALLDLVRSRFKHGLDTDLEKLSAEQNIYDIERTLLGLEATIATGKHLLAALVGIGPDALQEISPHVQAINAFPLPENISIDLLARRPDLMAQIWRVEATAHEINAAKTNFYPNITLNGTGGLEGISFNTLFHRGSLMGALSPAIHLPIFTAGRIRAELDKSVALFDEAVYAYNELLLKAAQDVADQLVFFTKLSDQIRVQKMSLEAIRKTFALKFLRYTTGVSDYLTVIKAQEALLQERFIAADLTEQQLLHSVKLIKSLGGGYE